MIDPRTVAQDLKALTDDELTRVQLIVNGEVAVRLQDKRLKDRLTDAVTEAGSLGYSESEVADVFVEAQRGARGKKDPAANVPKPKIPKVMGRPINSPIPSIIDDIYL